MNNNLVIAICVVCATVFIVTLTGTSYLYRMKQLETTQSIAETKAEQVCKHNESVDRPARKDPTGLKENVGG